MSCLLSLITVLLTTAAINHRYHGQRNELLAFSMTTVYVPISSLSARVTVLLIANDRTIGFVMLKKKKKKKMKKKKKKKKTTTKQR